MQFLVREIAFRTGGCCRQVLIAKNLLKNRFRCNAELRVAKTELHLNSAFSSQTPLVPFLEQGFDFCFRAQQPRHNVRAWGKAMTSRLLSFFLFFAVSLSAQSGTSFTESPRRAPQPAVELAHDSHVRVLLANSSAHV